MHLKKLVLKKFPGFRTAFMISNIQPGLNIIIGPNASGKTSICQAVRRLLWPKNCEEHYRATEIFSEWFHNKNCFTIDVAEGKLDANISNNGRSVSEQLPQEHLIPCFSITIDELFNGNDKEFAQKIIQEIAGGYDIQTASYSLKKTVSAKSIVKDWKNKEKNFDDSKKDHKTALEESRKLPQLEQEIKKAQNANDKANELQQIIDLCKAYHKILIKKDHLEKFPIQLKLSKIKTNDWEQYQSLTTQHDEKLNQLKALESVNRELEKSVGKWREISLSEEELEIQNSHIQIIKGLIKNKRDTEEIIPELETSIEINKKLFGFETSEEIEKIDASYLDECHQKLQTLECIDGEISGIGRVIQWLNKNIENSSYNHAKALELLCNIANSLSSDFWWHTCAALLTIGCMLLFFDDWKLYLILFPLSTLASLLMKKIRGFNEIQSYKKWGFCSIEMTPEGISKEIIRIVDEWSDIKQAHSHKQRKSDEETVLEGKKTERESLAEELFKRAEEIGVPSSQIRRVHFTENLKKLLEDYKTLKTTNVKLEDIGTALKAAWGNWAQFSKAFDIEVTNAEQLDHAYREIREINKKIYQFNQNSSAVENTKKEVAGLERKIVSLLTCTECINEPDKLEELVKQLSEYQRCKAELTVLEEEFEELLLKNQISKEQIIEAKKEILEQEKASEGEQAKKLQGLAEEKGRLQAKLLQMETDSKVLEELEIVKERAKQASLDFAKNELLEILIKETQQSFQSESQPQVLEKASEWFQRFTKNKFKLEAPLSSNASLEYEVLDTTTGERKNLNQLSRGTRMQLLMAIRLSFANEKTKVVFPIFLDEVLANTDPVRFDAVTEVISELIKEGRQIFYLTCNPEDVTKWKHRCPDANIIDLLEVQHQQVYLASPLPILERVPRFSAPSSETLEEYARKNQLPAIRMDEPLEKISIHYLIDNVYDLHRLLESGIETFGNLVHLPSRTIEQSFPNSLLLIEKRKNLLSEFFRLKTQGRGKAVSRQVLSDGGISSNFIDKLWELSQELHCDSKKLVENLKDKKRKNERTKGLRTENITGLENYLLEHGYIDDREIFSDDQIRRELIPCTPENKDREFIEILLAHTAQKQNALENTIVGMTS